jgi:hypothetical protein
MEMYGDYVVEINGYRVSEVDCEFESGEWRIYRFTLTKGDTDYLNKDVANAIKKILGEETQIHE